MTEEEQAAKQLEELHQERDDLVQLVLKTAEMLDDWRETGVLKHGIGGGAGTDIGLMNEVYMGIEQAERRYKKHEDRTDQQ